VLPGAQLVHIQDGDGGDSRAMLLTASHEAAGLGLLARFEGAPD
jgi:hypothetical protein